VEIAREGRRTTFVPVELSGHSDDANVTLFTANFGTVSDTRHTSQMFGLINTNCHAKQLSTLPPLIIARPPFVSCFKNTIARSDENIDISNNLLIRLGSSAVHFHDRLLEVSDFFGEITRKFQISSTVFFQIIS
jgi:hypothetical protein